MAGLQDHRRTPRISTPTRVGGRALGILDFRLLNLSTKGARIEHVDPMRLGSVWALELPAALGELVLSAQVIWSTQFDGKQVPTGARSRGYQSGLTFVGLTVDQQTALTRILEGLRRDLQF